MAQGHADPVWPLPSVTPKFAEWSFGGGRPFDCAAGKCKRWHAGIDLIGAPDRAIVVSTETMEIVGVDKSWSEGTMHVTGRTETGLFLVYGGTIKGSGDEWGIKPGMTVEADHPLGRIKGSYGMLHFETYAEREREQVRETSTPWYVGDPPPPGILSPLNYVQRAAGREQTLANWIDRRQALRDLGFGPADSGPWGTLDTDALIEAQAALDLLPGIDLEPDGLWGPKTDAAIRSVMATTKPLIPPAKPTPATSTPAPPTVDQDELPTGTGYGWRDFIVPALALGAVAYTGYRITRRPDDG